MLDLISDYNDFSHFLRDDVMEPWSGVTSQTNRGIPVVKDSIQLDVTKTLIEINQSDDDNLLSIDLQSDEMNDMGGSSQVQCYLSQ